MIKTEIQVERDFYSFVKSSKLGKAIKGSVYRSDMRPADAKTEDLIVKFLAGLDEQVQSGVVISMSPTSLMTAAERFRTRTASASWKSLSSHL